MTIIKHGNPKPKIESMIAECEACGCVFTFGEHESVSSSNNGGGYLYFASCPECHSTGPSFDTGYPGDSDRDLESNRQVKEKQLNLRSLIK